MTLCFYFKSCGRPAQLEKQGKCVCRECAEPLKGLPYPLRPPRRAPLYDSDRELAHHLSLLDES